MGSSSKAVAELFRRPIDEALDDYELYLDSEGLRDTGQAKQVLADARRHVDLLIEGTVALTTQDEPGEVARLREQLATKQGLLDRYQREITEANREHNSELANLRAKLAAEPAVEAERNKLRKDLEKVSERLRAARETIQVMQNSRQQARNRQVEVDQVATHLIRALAYLEGVQVVEEDMTRVPAAGVRLVLGPTVARAMPWPMTQKP
jgi:chromosome segregation ATPase